MSIENVVINASPFILLSKCGLIELLPRLFGQVFMPNSVAVEIARGNDAASILLRDLDDKMVKARFRSNRTRSRNVEFG